MRDFVLEKVLQKLGIPEDVKRIFSSGHKYVIPNSREELMELSMAGHDDHYDIEFDIPGRGRVKEAWATKVKNGVVVNYTDPYMRKREPNCLFIADDKPTDKRAPLRACYASMAYGKRAFTLLREYELSRNVYPKRYAFAYSL